MKGADMERTLITKINGNAYSFDVYDTKPISLAELINKNISWACEWDNYYIIRVETNDPLYGELYLIDKDTKKIEWGQALSLGFVAEFNGKDISIEEFKKRVS